MIIHHITDKKSRGILSYLEQLLEALSENNNSIEIKNWNNILFKKCDIAHFHYSNSTSKILIFLPFFNATSRIVTVHDVIPRRYMPSFFVQCVYKYLNFFVDDILVHSNFAKELLLEKATFIPKEKVLVIPHGCQVTTTINKEKLRNKYDLNKEHIIFIMAGYIKKRKGQIDVIKIFRELTFENIMLLIVGKPLDQDSKNELKRLPNHTIKYLGYVNDNEFLEYIQLSNALINYRLESVGESSGPVQRAIGAGIPILYSNVGSFPETIRNGGMKCNSLEELKKNIIKYCTDKENRDQLEDNIIEIRDEYTWNKVAKQHLLLYTKGKMGKKSRVK